MQEMQKTTVRFLVREDPLEQEMATHSSTLAWKILWTEEPSGYSPWGRRESDPLGTTQRLSIAHTKIVEKTVHIRKEEEAAPVT